MRECNFESRRIIVEKDGVMTMAPINLVKKDRACCIGYFVTPLRRNPGQELLVQDYESLPEYVLVDGIEFRKGDRAVLFEKPHRFVCAEYYRVDYKGRIKTDDGRWEKEGVIRPAYPVFLHRRIHFHGTRVLTMKY
jgi:hypothetical protein